MISVIIVLYKDIPVMFMKESRFPKHVAYLDQAEGLPNSPILWSVCYLMQIPSMEEITRMMGNGTSTICGRVSSDALKQRLKGKKTKYSAKKTKVMQPGPARDSVQPRNKMETRNA